MEGGKGCIVLGAVGGLFGFLLGLILLFAMASGGGDSSGGGGAGGMLNTAKVPSQYVQWVEEAGGKCGAVSAPLIAAQITQESDWNPNAESDTGAEGIAQFEPGTWSTWGVSADGVQPPSPWDAADGIVSMGVYDCGLAKIVAKVPGNPASNMLAAYNAGAGAVLQYNGVPPFAQTQAYVTRIESMIPEYTEALPSGSGAPDAFANTEIADAEKWLGTPYVWGGGGDFGPTFGLPNVQNPAGLPGFDCSGLVMYAVYQASHGAVQLPHSSEQDAELGTSVPLADIEPGDVVAIQMDPKSNPGDFSHIVIYVGGGEYVAAPTFGENVKLSSLNDFKGLPMAVRRFG